MKTRDSASARKAKAKPGQGNRPGTPVPTPDLDVTLAKRMKRRFSSRQGNSTLSDASLLSGTASNLSQQTQSMLGLSLSMASQAPGSEQSGRQSQRTRTRRSKPSSGKTPAGSVRGRLASATIDKFFPLGEQASAKSSPTKFQRSKVVDTDENESTADEVNDPEIQSMRTRRNQDRSSGDSQEESSAPESSNARTRGTKVASLTTRSLASASKRSAVAETSLSSGSQSDGAAESGIPMEGAGTASSGDTESDSVTTSSARAGRRRGQAALDIRQGISTRVRSNIGQAEQPSSSEDSRRRVVDSSTGADSDISLSDQQFVHNQVKLMSSAFSLEAGPGDWIAAWKRKNRSDEDEEDEDLPKHVVNRALSKLNKTYSALVKKKLSRAKQREIFRELVDVRERERVHGDSLLQANLRVMEEKLTTEPDNVLARFPETLPDARSDSKSGDLIRTYSKLRSRVSSLVDDSVASRQQLEHNQRLLQSLQGINTMDVPSSDELQSELERSRMLVTKVVEKLRSGKYRRTHSPRKTSPHKKPSTNLQPLPNSHLILMSTLFDKGSES